MASFPTHFLSAAPCRCMSHTILLPLRPPSSSCILPYRQQSSGILRSPNLSLRRPRVPPSHHAAPALSILKDISVIRQNSPNCYQMEEVRPWRAGPSSGFWRIVYKVCGHPPARVGEEDFSCPAAPMRANILEPAGRAFPVGASKGKMRTGLQQVGGPAPPFSSFSLETTMSEPKPSKRRSFVRDLLDLLTGNHMLDDEACATYLGVTKRTVQITRSSDSFKSLLALNIQKQHADAIHAVRNNALLAANEALETGRRLMQDIAVIPSLKIEVMKVVLENHHRAEERLIPKGPTGGQPGAVSINLTFNELQEARQSALEYGKNLELEASNHAHTPEIQMGRHHLLSPVSKDGAKV